MSEENTDKPAAGDKPAPKKAPAKKAAAKTTAAKKPAAKATAKRAAPKKTGTTGAKSTTKAAASKATPAKAPAAKKSTASRKATSKPAAKKPVSVPEAAAEDTPAATAAAAGSAPQHGDVMDDMAPDTAIQPDEQTSTSYESATEDEKAGSEDRYTAENIASEFKEKDWGNVGLRAAFTLFYIFASWVAVAFGGALTIIQFLIYLVSGESNDVIRRGILSIGRYIGDVAAYFSFASNERPFPFGKDLPNGDE